MKKIKRALCLISSIFAISAATLTASALNGSGSLGDVATWNVKNNIVSLKDTNGNWSAECKGSTLHVKGKKLENVALSSDSLFTPENTPLVDWFANNVILKVFLDVNEVDAILSIDYATNNVSQVTIGKNVKKLSGSCKVNNENLKNIAVIAKDIELEGTNIGYNADGEPIADVIIHGYAKSTAVDYAKNNGFEFMEIGDISKNGKIDLFDAIEIAKYMAHLREFDDEEAITADYNGDNTINLFDAIEVAKELARQRRTLS